MTAPRAEPNDALSAQRCPQPQRRPCLASQGRLCVRRTRLPALPGPSKSCALTQSNTRRSAPCCPAASNNHPAGGGSQTARRQAQQPCSARQPLHPAHSANSSSCTAVAPAVWLDRSHDCSSSALPAPSAHGSAFTCEQRHAGAPTSVPAHSIPWQPCMGARTHGWPACAAANCLQQQTAHAHKHAHPACQGACDAEQQALKHTRAGGTHSHAHSSHVTHHESRTALLPLWQHTCGSAMQESAAAHPAYPKALPWCGAPNETMRQMATSYGRNASSASRRPIGARPVRASRRRCHASAHTRTRCSPRTPAAPRVRPQGSQPVCRMHAVGPQLARMCLTDAQGLRGLLSHARAVGRSGRHAHNTPPPSAMQEATKNPASTPAAACTLLHTIKAALTPAQQPGKAALPASTRQRAAKEAPRQAS